MDVEKKRITRDGRRITLYNRVCTCGDSTWVTYKPKEGAICRVCRGKNQAEEMRGKNTKGKEDLVRYDNFCPDCFRSWVTIAKRQTPYCGDCNRIRIGKANKKTKFFKDGTPKPRHFRICPDCPEESNTVEVASKENSGVKHCRHHRVIVKTKDKKPKDYKPIGTDGAKRNKVTVQFQVIDPETMEPPKPKKKKVEYPVSTPEQDKAMIDNFIRKQNENNDNQNG